MQDDSQDIAGKKRAGLVNLYTLGEAAAVLGVSRREVWDWVQEEALPIVRLGTGRQMIRIRQADLEAFAAESFEPHKSPELDTLRTDKDES